MKTLTLRVFTPSGLEPQIVKIGVRDLIVAGWTGRDPDAIKRHIEELGAIGVKRPKRSPIFYRVATDRLTLENDLEVVGLDSTGEVEFLLLQGEEGLLVGLGSDHTDRKAEVFGITLSKQMCPKPIAPDVWRWEDVEPHWDDLQMRCLARTPTCDVLYQEGCVTAMLHPNKLLEHYELAGGKFSSGSVMFCGTLAAKNRITWANGYQLELIDPVLRRKIQHSYSLRPLPIAEDS